MCIAISTAVWQHGYRFMGNVSCFNVIWMTDEAKRAIILCESRAKCPYKHYGCKIATRS